MPQLSSSMSMIWTATKIYPIRLAEKMKSLSKIKTTTRISLTTSFIYQTRARSLHKGRQPYSLTRPPARGQRKFIIARPSLRTSQLKHPSEPNKYSTTPMHRSRTKRTSLTKSKLLSSSPILRLGNLWRKAMPASRRKSSSSPEEMLR